MSLAFFKQENLIFFPEKLQLNHEFSFEQEFEEIFVQTTDGIKLHGLLFKTTAPKGLVFYLHGNAGSVNSWGWAYESYTNMGYDFFILDYRGYGKSEGSISSEGQFYDDVQRAYDQLKNRYNEPEIVIAGYSIGTAAATKLASENNPKLLILQAPYYSLSDLASNLYPIIPGFLLKYKFETFRFLDNVKAPVAIFHGDKDEIIYHGSADKLKAHLKPADKNIILSGQGHNGMNENPDYQRKLDKLINTLNQR
ncbi:lysophospholipase [Pontibacter aydingkolensis]|uniref:Lysophospholipase n=2 Tax=Pontibacter aydingkolensis TaxID=1911536 RepID=A0ABS7CZB0_9BACT|nr:lysophospholipase [Pontibacter aydingkolensis]